MFPTELRHHFQMGGIPAWLRKLAFGVDGARAQLLSSGVRPSPTRLRPHPFTTEMPEDLRRQAA